MTAMWRIIPAGVSLRGSIYGAEMNVRSKRVGWLQRTQGQHYAVCHEEQSHDTVKITAKRSMERAGRRSLRERSLRTAGAALS
jgi:hypothetical protein